MESIKLFSQSFKSESFSGKKLSKFIAEGCEFVDCKFESMRVDDFCFGSGRRRTYYVNCSFDNSCFSSDAPGIAHFERCSFKNVKIEELFCVDVDFIDCTFSGEILKGNFVGIRHDVDGGRHLNEFYGNDFSGLKFGDVGFNDIDLSQQKLPCGSDFMAVYDVKEFLGKAKAEAAGIKEQRLSGLVHSALEIIELESEGGNNQIFIDKRSFPKNLQEAVNTIFSFFER